MSSKTFNNKLRVLVVASLVLASCKPEADVQAKHNDIQLVNFAGKLLALGKEVTEVQYADVARKKQSRAHAVDPTSTLDELPILQRFGLKMQYYPVQQNPQQFKLQPVKDQPQRQPQWLRIMVNAADSQQLNLNATTARFIFDSNKPSSANIEPSDYRYMQIPTHQRRYGLVKFAPHPKWVRRDGYQRTHDLYLDYAAEGQVRSYIQCDNRQLYALDSQCKMYWNLEPMLRAQLQLSFLRSQLEDWQNIRASAEHKILAMLIHGNS